MNDVDLVVCPLGGEHFWGMWYDEDEAELIIDCDRCHQEAYRSEFRSEDLWITPLPVNLEMDIGKLKITPRVEV